LDRALREKENLSKRALSAPVVRESMYIRATWYIVDFVQEELRETSTEAVRSSDLEEAVTETTAKF